MLINKVVPIHLSHCSLNVWSDGLINKSRFAASKKIIEWPQRTGNSIFFSWEQDEFSSKQKLIIDVGSSPPPGNIVLMTPVLQTGCEHSDWPQDCWLYHRCCNNTNTPPLGNTMGSRHKHLPTSAILSLCCSNWRNVGSADWNVGSCVSQPGAEWDHVTRARDNYLGPTYILIFLK